MWANDTSVGCLEKKLTAFGVLCINRRCCIDLSEVKVNSMVACDCGKLGFHDKSHGLCVLSEQLHRFPGIAQLLTY